MRFENFDLVYSGQLTYGEAGLAAKICGVPYVCDIRNPWTVQMSDFTSGVRDIDIIKHKLNYNEIYKLQYIYLKN